MPGKIDISEADQITQTDMTNKPLLPARTDSQILNDSQTQLLTIWKMRWFFVINMSIWIFVALIITVVAFCITRSPFSLSLFTALAPPVYILIRITKYLFPRDDNDFRLAAMRIKRKPRGTALPFDIDAP